MSMYSMEMGFVVSDFGSPEDLERHLDCVLEALEADARVTDPDYGATLSTGDVEFSLSVDAEAEGQAVDLALLVLRTAIHTADGCTPGWEAHFTKTQTLVRADFALA